MYIYVSQDGFIKEIVNDAALRQANDNINHIYIYIDNFAPSVYTGISATYKLPSGAIIGPQAIPISSVDTKAVPYNKKRDLKFFVDYKEYPFYDIAIPDGSDPLIGSALSETGLVKCTIAFLNSTTTFALQVLPFYVAESVVRQTYNITSDQYNYLLQFLSSQKVINFLKSAEVIENGSKLKIIPVVNDVEGSPIIFEGGGFKLIDESTSKQYKTSLKVTSDGKCHFIAEEI